jgi:hypothetical protein
LYLDTLSEEHFTSFLDDRVRLMLPASAVGVFDNAAIHHSLGSRLMLEDVFTNLYYFLPVYSPHLNPIEPCFALVKEWIRHHEVEALVNPVVFINRAFSEFALGGPSADSVMGHFQLYFANHEAFLQN